MVFLNVPEHTGAPIDFEGMKWWFRGIHGGSEQLQNVLTDAPLKISGHDLPYHFFVSYQRFDFGSTLSTVVCYSTRL